MLIFYTKRA